MKTMGLSRLALVAPEQFPHLEAHALAAGADDVLEAAEVHADLASAVAGCRFVLGTTARRRTVAMPEHAAARGRRALLLDAQAPGAVALVFGRERTGLENEELQRCHAAVCIPADPDYSSLNLAAAVQVLSYELRMAALGDAPAAIAVDPADPEALPATHEQMERFFAHLGEVLDDIDFHKGRDPGMITQRVRRLFLRAQPDCARVAHPARYFFRHPAPVENEMSRGRRGPARSVSLAGGDAAGRVGLGRGGACR